MSGGAQVTACLVTRGDVDLTPILESLPPEWPVAVWDNSVRDDLKVYGRYALLKEIETPLAYVQDDDVIVSDPQVIVDAWLAARSYDFAHPDHKVSDPLEEQEHLVANMPTEFRPHYPDSCLVGFGACFHRDAPARAFEQFRSKMDLGYDELLIWGHSVFARTCDVVFTTLTPRVLVDVPKVNREFAEDASRMYRQPGHVEERARMLELARRCRDA